MDVIVHFHDQDKKLVSVKGIYNPQESEIESIHNPEWTLIGVSPTQDDIDISMKRKRDETSNDDEDVPDKKYLKTVTILDDYIDYKNGNAETLQSRIKHGSHEIAYIKDYLHNRFTTPPYEDKVKNNRLWNICVYYITSVKHIPYIQYILDEGGYNDTFTTFYEKKSFYWNVVIEMITDLIITSRNSRMIYLWIVWMFDHARKKSTSTHLHARNLFLMIVNRIVPYSDALRDLLIHFSDKNDNIPDEHKITYQDFIDNMHEGYPSDSSFIGIIESDGSLAPELKRINIIDYYYDILRTDSWYEVNKTIFAINNQMDDSAFIQLMNISATSFNKSIKYALKLTVPIIKMNHWYFGRNDRLDETSYIIHTISYLMRSAPWRGSSININVENKASRLYYRDTVLTQNNITEWYSIEKELIKSQGFQVASKKRIDKIIVNYPLLAKFLIIRRNTNEFISLIRVLMKESSKSNDFRLGEIADLCISVILRSALDYDKGLISDMLSKMKDEYFNGLGQVTLDAIREFNPNLNTPIITRKSTNKPFRNFNAGFNNIKIVQGGFNNNTILF